MQTSINNIMFHDNVTTSGTGYELSVNSITMVNIEFETEGTFSATIEVKAHPDSTEWKPYVCCNMATLDIATTVSDKSYVYQIDTSAISYLRVNLTSVSDTITVYGKCIG